MKLELGAGHRPTRGYEHNDLHPFDHIEHIGEPWMLDLPDNSVEEVLALAFIEHLTYDQARDTFRNVYRMLVPEGVFLFDVPDYPVWCRYYLDALDERSTPVPLEHIRRTLFGWQRWPGDEHKSGWDMDLLAQETVAIGFAPSKSTDKEALKEFRKRAYRRRFYNAADAHIYAMMYKR